MTGDHRHPKIPMDLVLAHELEIIGSHGMQAFQYPRMLEMIKSGKLQPEKLIDKTITLAEACSLLPSMNKFEHSGVMVIDNF
jgi:alcohol dehydrogenase